MTNEFKYPHWKPGDLIEVVVGIPGPDRELAIVTEVRDGRYFFKSKVFGKGEWHYEDWEHKTDVIYTPITARGHYYPYFEEYLSEAQQYMEAK
jgi:hypothetical protein